jgi:hypothetical protein
MINGAGEFDACFSGHEPGEPIAPANAQSTQNRRDFSTDPFWLPSKYCFPPIAAIEDVIDSACELDTSFPGHELDQPAVSRAGLSSLFAEIHELTPILRPAEITTPASRGMNAHLARLVAIRRCRKCRDSKTDPGLPPSFLHSLSLVTDANSIFSQCAAERLRLCHRRFDNKKPFFRNRSSALAVNSPTFASK